MALEREFAAFKQKLPELLRTLKGKFVVIHGDDVEGSWDTENEAYAIGCQRFGVEPFLVMPVEEHERPLPFYQDVAHADPSRPA